MGSSAAKKPVVARERRTARRGATTRRGRERLLIDDVTAILLISPNAKDLCEFYRATLGLPLEEERHEEMPLHYGYSLGDVHFAIHSADGGWSGVPSRNSLSPVISFSTSDLKTVAKRLAAKGVKVTGPTDHGFAQVIVPRSRWESCVDPRVGPECW